MLGVARPKRPSVTRIGRISTQSASRPAPTRAAATSRELQSSPRPAIPSSSAGESWRSWAAMTSRPSCWASATMASTAAEQPGRSRPIRSCRSSSSATEALSPVPSPDPQRWASVRRSSVTPARAETTTTGRKPARDRTISISRPIAAASATDVPPNLATIMALAQRWCSAPPCLRPPEARQSAPPGRRHRGWCYALEGRDAGRE